jgi:hypothetical protein
MNTVDPKLMALATTVVGRQAELIMSLTEEAAEAIGSEAFTHEFVNYVMFGYSAKCLKDLIGAKELRAVFERTFVDDLNSADLSAK